MTFREIVMSSLQGKKPRFLQIGFVVVFLLCMGTQTIYAQKTKRNKLKQTEEHHIVGERDTIVEIMPEFPGGEEARVKFLQENLQYPKEAREAGIEGRVVVGFVVEPDGRLTNFTVVRGVIPILDEEALRVIKLMPNWIPGKQRGKQVRVLFQVPIIFGFNDKKSEENPIE